MVCFPQITYFKLFRGFSELGYLNLLFSLKTGKGWTFEEGVEDLRKKIPAKPLQLKQKSRNTNGYKKNACTALKKLLAPLASEKKILALTNSSTLPFTERSNGPPLNLFREYASSIRFSNFSKLIPLMLLYLQKYFRHWQDGVQFHYYSQRPNPVTTLWLLYVACGAIL